MASTDLPGRSALVRDPASEKRAQILLVDISRVYFNAKTSEEDPVYVDFLMEAGQPEGTCGLLRRHMYGTRRAAEGWQDEYSAALISEGFTQGRASACVFSHSSRGISVSVHGDHFAATGPRDQLDWFETRLKSHCELTVGGRLGPGPTEDKEARVLNRIIRWTDKGF